MPKSSPSVVIETMPKPSATIYQPKIPKEIPKNQSGGRNGTL
jgi:hypothetical protein